MPATIHPTHDRAIHTHSVGVLIIGLVIGMLVAVLLAILIDDAGDPGETYDDPSAAVGNRTVSGADGR